MYIVKAAKTYVCKKICSFNIDEIDYRSGLEENPFAFYGLAAGVLLFCAVVLQNGF